MMWVVILYNEKLHSVGVISTPTKMLVILPTLRGQQFIPTFRNPSIVLLWDITAR
jgi:hypothetical protein